MPKKLVSDELRSLVEPLLPEHKPTSKGGRPRISNSSFERNYICPQDWDTMGRPATGDGLR